MNKETIIKRFIFNKFSFIKDEENYIEFSINNQCVMIATASCLPENVFGYMIYDGIILFDNLTIRGEVILLLRDNKVIAEVKIN